MGSEPLDKNKKLYQCQNNGFLKKFTKIDGFEGPSLKIDGFGQTHWTHADGTTVLQYLNSFGLFF